MVLNNKLLFSRSLWS